jgi:4-amino-4-deoxy-L-arabinose transferase-like glycosyltransferase
MNFAFRDFLKGGRAPALFLLLAVACLLLFPLLGTEGLTDPDESAYAESVREMAERGDWLVPHLYGQPLLDKPILIYWVMGASFRLLGEGELAARLPSALAAIALLLAVWRLGKLVHQSDIAGLLSALVLASSLEFVLLGRAAVTDMLLTLFCTLAILCYVETLWGQGSRLLPLAGAAFLGIAVLTKGPVGLLIPGMVLGACMAASRGWRRWREIRPFASTLIFLAVAVPWYAAVALQRPDLVQEFFVTGNLGRFLKAEHRPVSPLYYGVVLLIGFLPWSAFLPGAMGRALAGWKRKDPSQCRLLLPTLWLLTLIVFFTLAASKLPSYILPALPAAAILAAEPLTAWLKPTPAGKRLPGTGAMLLLVILTGGMIYFAMSRQSFGSIPGSIKTALLPVCFAGLLGTLFALSALIMQRAKLAYLILQGGSVTLILSLLLFGFPILEPWKSSREAANATRPMLQSADRLVLYRESHPGFGYYLHRIPELVHSEPALEGILGEPGRVFCLMGRGNYEKLRARRPDLPLYLLKNAGHVVVLTNRSPGESP